MVDGYITSEGIKYITLRERPNLQNARGHFFQTDSASTPLSCRATALSPGPPLRSSPASIRGRGSKLESIPSPPVQVLPGFWVRITSQQTFC